MWENRGESDRQNREAASIEAFSKGCIEDQLLAIRDELTSSTELIECRLQCVQTSLAADRHAASLSLPKAQADDRHLLGCLAFSSVALFALSAWHGHLFDKRHLALLKKSVSQRSDISVKPHT